MLSHILEFHGSLSHGNLDINTQTHTELQKKVDWYV